VASTGASIVIFLNVTSEIFQQTNLAIVNIVAVALAVITLYLTHIAGTHLRSGRSLPVAGLCVLSWAAIGFTSIWFRTLIRCTTGFGGTRLCETDSGINAETLVLSALYLAIGLVAAIGPAVPQRGSPTAKNASPSAEPAVFEES
jgi:hypothetical protein